MRTMQIKQPSRKAIKQNLLVAAIIDVDLAKERRTEKNENCTKNSKRF